MNNKIYWIWAQNALKYGSHKIKAIISYYKNIGEFYRAGEREWRLCGIFTNKEISSLISSTIEKAAIILEKSVSLGHQIITFDDEEYPKKLKHIANPPCVLYVKGSIKNIDKKLCISIVGTRKASSYGLETASKMAYDLSEEGVIIVSGGALGIDRAAHIGAIKGSGETIAVLGCGINYRYLIENELLRAEISKNGALISEYPPDFPAISCNFPIRNRIISGLSSGTVVVEAGERSGSLITANLANEQNRDVFAVLPLDTNNSASKGTISLIKDGAKVATSAKDILDEYNIKYVLASGNIDFHVPKRATDTSEKHKVHIGKNKKIKRENFLDTANDSSVSGLEKLSKECKEVYLFIKNNGKSHVDEIALGMNAHIKNILPAITELEILGLINSYPGKIYGVK